MIPVLAMIRPLLRPTDSAVGKSVNAQSPAMTAPTPSAISNATFLSCRIMTKFVAKLKATPRPNNAPKIVFGDQLKECLSSPKTEIMIPVITIPNIIQVWALARSPKTMPCFGLGRI